MTDAIYLYPLLFLSGLAAGWIDSIAGGGGLISLPTLLACGYPPHLALGTNKLQSSFGSFTASYNYIKQGGISLREATWGIIFTAIGAALGAAIVQLVHTDILSWIMPFLLLATLIFVLLSPDLGERDTHVRMAPTLFYLVFGLSIGFYDGFFGPGTGSFWPIAFVLLLGHNLIKATGYTKVMNFTSNIVALITFIIGGKVLWTAGLVMAVGQTLGAKIGSGMVIKNGVKFIRPIFIFVVLATTIKMIYDNLK